MLFSSLIILLIALLFSIVSAIDTKEDLSSRCLEKGFQLGSLDCATCSILQETLNDEELHQDCLECCEAIANASKSEEEEVYEYALLEIDKRWLNQGLKDVIKKKKALNLKVKYTFGVRPQLHLFKNADDDVNNPSDTITVTSWEGSTIEDYLTSHVKPSKAHNSVPGDSKVDSDDAVKDNLDGEKKNKDVPSESMNDSEKKEKKETSSKKKTKKSKK